MSLFQNTRSLVTMLIFSLSGACVTPRNIYSLGEPDVAIKTSAYVELKQEDWASVKSESCITHLYRCRFDATGKVTDVEAMDLSAPQFQGFSDEAIRTWTFKPGKSGQCYVDFIYSSDSGTKVLIMPEAMAKQVAEKRSSLRKEAAQAQQKAKAKSIKTVMPNYPRDAIFRGIAGVVTVLFDLNPEGVPENLQIQRSEPKDIFDQATLRAVGKWRYPTLAQEPDKERKGLRVTIYFKPTGSLGYECELGY